MSDDAPSPQPGHSEDLLAFRLAKKALFTMGTMLAPVVLIASWLGYDKYSDLNAKYQESTSLLIEATNATRAQADSLKALADSLRFFVRNQTAELADASNEADRSRLRQEAFYTQLVQQSATDRAALLQSVNLVSQLSSKIEESTTEARAAAQVVNQVEPEVRRLSAAYESAQRTAQQALTIAEEASVQTVGAGSRRELYGTPFDIYFSGISRDALRDLTISFREGPTIKTAPRTPSTEVVSIEVGDITYQIAIANVLDIPGGLLRLNGSSRADAATFRVTRIRTAAAPQARLIDPSPHVVVQ